MKKGYYLDSCIWLNLFKKEGDVSKGIPYWKIALHFIRHIEDKNRQIYVSTIILKELRYILGGKFPKILNYFKKAGFIKIIKTKGEDYDLARKLEEEDNSEISFYDYLHVAIVKRLKCIFVTRDRDLLNFSKSKINVDLPENLSN
ncbi:MAG TPA: type II toxin-antitoxin system VapC family toxin [Candidatus Pacearchaeota archaeon]|nr:type II toxin-antitoxin system VapC family toxin [Candidatus Pacearchaeota archaeon]